MQGGQTVRGWPYCTDVHIKHRAAVFKTIGDVWAVFVDAWRCLEMLGDAWRCLEMLGDICRYLEMFGDIWRYWAVFVDPWRCLEMLGNAWRCLEMFGDVWRYLEIFGDIWRCLIGDIWRYLEPLVNAGGHSCGDRCLEALLLYVRGHFLDFGR